MSPDTQLWNAVLDRALTDAIGLRRYQGDSMEAHIYAVRVARAWFKDAGPDFRTVCHYADLEPECVRAGALKRIAAEGIPLPRIKRNRRKVEASARKRYARMSAEQKLAEYVRFVAENAPPPSVH